MRLRSFTAASMPAAMEQARAALGDDAVIISTATKGKSVTVTAAIDEKDEGLTLVKPLRANRQVTSWLEDLTTLLRYHNIPEPLAGRLAYKARNLELDSLFALQKLEGDDRALLEQKALAKLLADVFKFLPFTNDPRLMLVGPPGIGKTVAIAKLAAQLVMERKKLTVITTDTKRAGGVEQLAAFTDILELQLNVAETPEVLSKALRAADGCVLIDSAGCTPYDKADMAELTSFIAAGGFEPVLTLPAGIDGSEAADTARAFAFSAITRLLVTRADTSRRFGSLLAAADARGLAFCNLSLSSRVVGELRPLDASLLAQLMLQYRKETC